MIDEVDLDKFVSREEAIRFLEVPEIEFNKLLDSGRLNLTYARTKPNPIGLFDPLTEHPDNEEWYSVRALTKLKSSFARGRPDVDPDVDSDTNL